MTRPTIGAQTESQGTAITLTVTLPSHSEGDLIVISGMCTRVNTTMTINESYTALHAVQGITDTRSLCFRSFAKIAGASETNPVITAGATPVGMFAIATAFGGAGAAADVQASFAIASGPDNDPNWASTSVDDTDSVAFRYCWASDDNQAVSEPSPPSAHTSEAFGENSGGTLGFAALSVNADPATLAAATWTGLWGSFAVGEVEGILTLIIPPSAASVTYEQEGFRFRNDDDNEADATWRQTQDVDDSVLKETNIRLRVLTDTTGDSPTVTRTLQYRRDDEATTEWRDV